MQIWWWKDCNTAKVRNEDSSYDLAFKSLTAKLDIGFAQGHICRMDNVSTVYCSFLKEAGVEDPLTSRTNKLKEKLAKHYGKNIQMRQQKDKTQPLLIFPVTEFGDAVESLINTIEADSSRLRSSCWLYV